MTRFLSALVGSLVFLLAANLSAQTDSAAFNADFRFTDGVYFSHAALLANQPDLGWESIDGEMVQLPDDYRVQIANYGYKDVRINGDIVPYAISLDGLAYLFVRHDEGRTYHDFAGLRVRGHLSTIRYDTTITTRHLMKAYNPANGRPFRQAYVERDKKLTLDKILHLRSGALVPLNRANLARLCADDDKLSKAIRETDEGNTEMLLRALRLYDDRHPVRLPLPPASN